MVKIEYYDTTRVLSRQKPVNMIIGPRGYGKTYGYKRYLINKAIKGEGKFVYMRRKDTEVKEMVDFFGDVGRDPMFADKGYEFRTKGREFYYSYERDEDDKPLWLHIGSIISLSTQSNIKSREFGEYKYLMFDEWLPLTVREFLRDEPKKFLSALDTIFRLRDFQIFLIGNSSTLFNPYFDYWKITPSFSKEFTDYKDDRGILIQWIMGDNVDKWAEIREQSMLGKFMKGSEYADYANKNEFIDNDLSLVEDKTAMSKNIMIFKLDGFNIGIWRDDKTGFIYFSEDYNSSVLDKYAFDPDEVDLDYQSYRNLLETNQLSLLQLARRKNLIRFTSAKAKAHSKDIVNKIHIL